MPDIGIVVIAASALADHRHRPAIVWPAGRVEPDRDRDARMQVGVAVVADRRAPVPADSRDVVLEIAMPAAPRAIIGDPLAQPVPLYRSGRGLRVQDQARKLIPAPLVIGGLVLDQPCTTRTMAMLDMDRPTGRSTVANRAPAIRADPGQRRIVVSAAGDLPDCELGSGKQQLRAGAPVTR